MKRRQIETLQNVLSQAMQRDISTLAVLRDQIAKLRATEADLDVQARQEYPEASTIADLQCYEAWTRWADRKVLALHAEEAALEEKAEAARKVLARSFGKSEAVKSLQERAELQELYDARRNAEQSGQAPDR